MTPRRLLVVTTVALQDENLRDHVRRHAGDGEAEVKVVAPATHVSPLEWLSSDEDEARREAAETAERTAEGLGGDARVEGAEVGDTDPIQAIEDALRGFEADEILVVTRPDEEADWLEEGAGEAAKERFGVPVTHLPYGG